MKAITDDRFRIRAVGPPEMHLLIKMYDRFDLLGMAFGLPPLKPEGRREWIGYALSHKLNVAAYSPAGETVGHCFLAGDKPGSAEMAIFVHQGVRRRGVGTALVNAALAWGAATGLRRVWSMTSADNTAALRLQENCGFRLTKCTFPEAELEIDLAVAGFGKCMGFRAIPA
jgi:RimJ/RimL family protein N-acetyltransferase